MDEEPVRTELVARAIGRSKDRGRRFILDFEKLEGVDYSGREYDSVGIFNSTLVRCNFARLRVSTEFCPGARNRKWFSYRARPSRFVECVFDGARMTFGPSGSARFERCSFRDVTLRDWLWGDVELVDCTFSGKLHDGVIWGASRSSNGRRTRRLEVVGNDFSGLEFDGVAFRGGVDLTKQRLPRDSRYVLVAEARDVLTRVSAAIASWADEELRRDGDAILKVLQFDVDSGQTQLLFDEQGFGHKPDPAAERIAQLLVEHGGTRQPG